jgi:UDP-3-O-[3-hydroxymyristoyl] glucosamine N-acyltransferase
MFTLGELAEQLGLTLRGDPQLKITGLATLPRANSEQLSFLANSKYQQYLPKTRAAAVIMHPDSEAQCPVACLLSGEPYLSYARASRLFENKPVVDAGVHPSACVDSSAQVHSSAIIGAHCSIGAETVIGSGVVLGPGTVIGGRCRIENNTVLYANVSVYHDVVIGAGCIIHSAVVLGSDGFGFASSRGNWEKIYQLGGVTIGSGVEIGAGTTIDRGALEDTVLEDGVIIDNLVQIAHNVHIGKNTAIAACTGIAGSTTIGADVHISAMSLVTQSISDAGSYSSGTTVTDSRQWRKNAVRFTQLDALHKRVSNLEKTKRKTDK